MSGRSSFGLSAFGWIFSIGKSIAEVSNPSRAATSAAAASSAAVGRSGRTIRASTKSIAPSPFVSRNATPGLKKSDSDDAAAGEGSVRPKTPLQKTRRQTRKFFMAMADALMVTGRD